MCAPIATQRRAEAVSSQSWPNRMQSKTPMMASGGGAGRIVARMTVTGGDVERIVAPTRTPGPVRDPSGSLSEAARSKLLPKNERFWPDRTCARSAESNSVVTPTRVTPRDAYARTARHMTLVRARHIRDQLATSGEISAPHRRQQLIDWRADETGANSNDDKPPAVHSRTNSDAMAGRADRPVANSGDLIQRPSHADPNAARHDGPAADHPSELR